MRRGGALVFPFSIDLCHCVEFHWLQAPLGLVCLSLFLFSPRARASSKFLPFPDKTWRLLRRLQQLKAEPGNSVTNCILMTDSLVSVFEQFQKTSYIHKSIITTSPSCQFSFSSLVLDAILAFEKLQMLHVRHLRFPTAPVCQEKKHS